MVRKAGTFRDCLCQTKGSNVAFENNACDSVRVRLNYLANVPTEEGTRSGAHCCAVFPLPISRSLDLYTHQSSSRRSLQSGAFILPIFTKQKLGKQKASYMLLTSPQLSATNEGKTSIQLNADIQTCSVCECTGLCNAADAMLRTFLNKLFPTGHFL